MLLNRFTRLKGIGRYACLGTAVLEALGRKYKIHNMQKGRIDYIDVSIQNSALTCKPDHVIPWLARDYIAPTIVQQSVICPDFHPKVIFVDSFSDLTDQMFRHRVEKWTFCSNYQDIHHNENFSEQFETLGLLDLSDLYKRYFNLSLFARERWGRIPIIYLNFPSRLEVRPKFIMRAEEIRLTSEVCARTIPDFYSFSVPDAIVKRPGIVDPGMEDFPYHYSEETYRAFANLISSNESLKKLFEV